jgi:hypothetical protein
MVVASISRLDRILEPGGEMITFVRSTAVDAPNSEGRHHGQERSTYRAGNFGMLAVAAASRGTPGSGLQTYAQVAPQPPGTARVWFMRTKAPQEQQGDPIIYVNGEAAGRSVGGVAFYHDYPPGTYTFTVQSYGVLAGQEVNKVTKQLAPGTQTYLEIEWGSSWLIGTVGGDTYFVRPLPPELDQAYLRMLLDKGPPRAL